MSRTVIASILLVLLIGIVALGMWLIGGHDEATTPPSSKSHAEQMVDTDTSRDSNRNSRSPGGRKLSPTTNQARRARPHRDLAVSGDLASALKLTDDEQEQINTLIAEIHIDRRQLFDEISGGDKSVDEVSREMGELRRQLNEEVRDLLGDERATALFEALSRAERYVSTND